MSHARTQIRDYVVATLTADITAALIVDTRIWIQQASDLPVIAVYTTEEDIDQDQSSFDAVYRTLALVTEIRVQGVDGEATELALDNLAEAVEVSLGDQRRALGMQDIWPATWESAVNTEGDTVTGSGTLTFSCQYRTAIGAPATII